MTSFKHLMVMAVLLFAVGCQSLNQPEPDSLYEDLGQRAGIAQIIEDMLYGVVDDTRIAFQFKGVDIVELHQGLTDHICQLSGGPCTYSGRDMREAHKDMNITATQFNALTENLILAMEKNRISTSAQNRLLARLAPLHSEVRNL
ncbi:group I truncated hemoglobin [Marinobacter caseinilyticus]|uniref:group I truncated hemoglobin n=1 Tax=Marinobacter caseinilyticus TaxID=2692195 RepID=UPI001407B31C